MDQTLYNLMDWPEIEAVVYSECQEPEAILGPHLTDDGVLEVDGRRVRILRDAREDCSGASEDCRRCMKGE